MNQAAIETQTLREYGVLATVSGARTWHRLAHPAPPRPIGTEHQYAIRVLAHVRRLGIPAIPVDPRFQWTFAWVDRRLVGVGWCKIPPYRMAKLLPRWVAYWWRAAPRPCKVGSSYNLDPHIVFEQFLWRVPSSVVRAGMLSRRRLSGRALRRRANAARAALRTSIPNPEAFGRDALRALGRLCPELQRVAVNAVKPQRSVIRARDIDWSEVSRAQKLLLTNDRARIVLALNTSKGIWGKRFQRLFAQKCPELVRHDSWEAIYRDDVARWLCPQYPGVSLENAGQLALGYSPEHVSGYYLTPDQADYWLRNYPGVSCGVFLLLSSGKSRFRLDERYWTWEWEPAVAKWMVRLEKDGSLGQVPLLPGAKTLVESLHLLAEEDLGGPDSDPSEVMGSAAARIALSAIAKEWSSEEDLPF